MKMARASKQEIGRAIILAGMLEDVDNGCLPRLPDGTFREEEEGVWFDENDKSHLRLFYERVMEMHHGLFRVTFGFATVMGSQNEVIDLTKDMIELHPRILAYLPTDDEEVEGTP